MLESMQNKATKVVVWILSVFLIASFGLWGIGDMFRGQTSQTPVAKVGDTEIPQGDLRDEFRKLIERARARLGGNFDAQQAVQLGLLDETLERMVNSRLVALEAHRLGLGAGETEIASAIRGSREFQGPGGGFQMDRYRVFLREQGLSEPAYVNIMRDEIVQGQLTGTVVAGVEPPKGLVDLVFHYRNEQRVAEVALVPPAELATIPDPDQATLEAFHKDNAAQFTAPEYRKATVLYLNPADRAKEMNPSEERLREEYEHRLPSISVPERRKLRQILLQDEEKARKAAEAVKQGRAFDEVAKEFSDSPPVDLGDLRKRDLPAEIADPAFGAKENAVVGPVQSPLGWHLIQVVSVSAGKTPSFEEMRDRVREDVAREMAVDTLIKLTAEIDDSLAGGAALEATAEKVNAKLLNIPVVDAQGRDASGNRVAGIPPDPRFLDQLFAAPVGQQGTLEETSQGGFYLIRVDDVTSPKLRPLDAVRTEAVEAWKKSQLADAAKKRADAVAAAARQAGDLGAAARTAELKVETSQPFTRFIRDPSSPVPDALAAALFKAKKGEVVVAPAEKGYAVGQLKEIVAGDPAKNESERKQVEDQLQGALANDVLAQFLEALHKRYPVEINRQVVNGIVSNDGAY